MHPTPRRPTAPRRVAAACALAAGLATALATAPALAAGSPALGYNSWAQVYGNLDFQYSSPLLGDVSFQVNIPSQYRSDGQWACTPVCGYTYTGDTGLASSSYQILSGQPGGTDPVYDLLTSGGQYGFSYDGQARSTQLQLHTQVRTGVTDASGLAATSNSTRLNGYAGSGFSLDLYIAPTAARPAGSYGAVLVGMTLDGGFGVGSDPSLGWANAQEYATSTFTDSAGVSYQSSFGIYTYAGDASWTGQSTVFKKLLFQYGTPFSVSMYQWASASNNAEADFFNTGYISYLELPYGATLESGAQQRGLGTAADLFGQVVNSATVDDANTNWDFGNNGGGFTPPVPEPSTLALWGAGLGLLLSLGRRRRAALDRAA